MLKPFSFICLLLLSLNALSQLGSYNDVAVIVNDNSPTSVNIANYFQAERSIPSANMIHITASTNEEIDSLEFENIRLQIETYITTNNLAADLNYLVTTKGVPLKVARGNCSNPLENCASFDSELALILGPQSSDIGQNGSATNPYLGQMSHFSSVSTGIYLVTRLSAYTEAEVMALIDRGGFETPVSKLSSRFIFDLSAVTDSISLMLFTAYLEPPSDNLVSLGWNSIFHPDTALLTNQPDVMGYVSLNNDPSGDVLSNSWANGAIADIFYSYSANTFDQSTNIANDLIIANLIGEGASGAHGNVYNLFTNDRLDHDQLFNKYLDTAGHFNLAEAYYGSMKNLSGSSVVIGDPKASIILDNTASIPVLDHNTSLIFPNPSKGIITIQTHLEMTRVEIYNMQGQLMHSIKDDFNAPIDLTSFSNGTYLLHIETKMGVVEEKLILLH